MKKFYKLLFENKSYASGSPFEYKINELLEYNNFNEDLEVREGGFFVSSIEVLLSSLIRGNTLYDAIVPDDAKIVNVPSKYIKEGRYKVNKVKLTNPRKLTDEMVLQLVDKTEVTDEVWAQIVAIVGIYGYIKTADKIIKDHINKNNIDIAIQDTKHYIEMDKGFGYVGVNQEGLRYILTTLEKMM